MATAGNDRPNPPHAPGSTPEDARVVKVEKTGRSRELFIGVLSTVIVGILIGSSAPWWWRVLFPQRAESVVAPAACPVDAIKDQLLGANGDASVFIESDARAMRELLRDGNIDCVEAIAGVLLRVDANNGSGLYFAGEVWRVRAKREPAKAVAWRERMREHFWRYVDAEKTLPSAQRDGKSEACYRRAKGFCAERTAWVSHLMAIDYLQQADEAGNVSARAEFLRRAADFVGTDVAYGGFDQVVPTVELQRRIDVRLRTGTAR